MLCSVTSKKVRQAFKKIMEVLKMYNKKEEVDLLVMELSTKAIEIQGKLFDDELSKQELNELIPVLSSVLKKLEKY